MAPNNTYMGLAGRVFSVTGGASGMGFATASLLAEHGAKAIWIADRQTGLFDEVRAKLSAINPSVEVYLENVDVSNSSEVDQWVDRIIAKHGVLHGAANIAGVYQSAIPEDTSKPALIQETDEAWRRIHSVNHDGVMYCTRAQFRVMYQKPETKPSIVNVSSMGAVLYLGATYAYCVSKAGAEHLTRSAAADGIQYGIRVNGVLPGQTNTPMLKQFFEGYSEQQKDQVLEQGGLSRIIEASDIAQAVVWLLSENASQVYGINVPVGAALP